MGVGAGWNEAEHRAFGVPLPGWRERFDRLEEGIARLRQTFEGRDIPFLVGGGGERRTRNIAAREADEWNYSAPDLRAFREKSAVKIGLPPSSCSGAYTRCVTGSTVRLCTRGSTGKSSSLR